MNALSLLWAQAPVPPGSPALLALRRWCGSLTLSPPSLLPRPFGLWVWLGGLGALLLAAMIAQGPWRALRQLLDVAALARLLGSSLSRLRRAGRLVAVTCGLVVAVWTANQAVAYLQSTSTSGAAANAGTVFAPQGSRDLRVLLFSKGVGEVAVEEGILAGLTCLRDLLGLGDYLLLVTVAAALVFRVSADRWSGVSGPAVTMQSSGTSWTTLYWGGAWLYALYRLAAMFDPGELPLGGCLFLEAALVPVLMAIADGLVLAWVLVELRAAGLSQAGGEPLDVNGAIALVPGSILACLLGLPARYLATGILLAFPYVPGFSNGAPEGVYARLVWTLIAAQGAALLFAGLAGAVAWSSGSWKSLVQGYVRLLATHGGHLTALLALAGVLAAATVALAYALVLTLPAQAWVLYAADSYAHYSTLVIGLLTMSALVELGEGALPLARRAEQEAAVAVNV